MLLLIFILNQFFITIFILNQKINQSFKFLSKSFSILSFIEWKYMCKSINKCFQFSISFNLKSSGGLKFIPIQTNIIVSGKQHDCYSFSGHN